MSFSAILVADGQPGTDCIRRSCLRDGRVDILGSASAADDAVALVSTTTPDAVFIDIDLTGVDAPALTRALRNLARPPLIVFVTAFADRAIIAFDLEVTDCVLKPAKAARVTQAIDRVVEGLSTRGGDEARGTDDLWLPRLGTMVRVPVSTIERVEAERDYARVWTPGGSFLLRTTMASIERRLAPDDFLRIHRSTIVALDKVSGCRHIGGGAWAVIDAKGERHAIGRRHLASVRRRLGLETSDDGPSHEQAFAGDHLGDPEDNERPVAKRTDRTAVSVA